MGSSWLLAWRERGSVAAIHWLPISILAALLVLVAVASGAARRPPRSALVGLAALAGLALWAALSSTWSPLPTLGRDEALLTLTYALAFAVPLLTLREARDRVLVLGVLAAAPAVLALATAAKLAAAEDPEALYRFDRLNFPVSYANAIAAVFLIGLWPALTLAAARSTHVVARGAAFAAAVTAVGGWLLTQSKGGGLGMLASLLVVLAVVPGRLRLLVPILGAAAFGVVGFRPLTEPYRAENEALAITNAARTLLVLAAAALVVGLVYALVDSRVEVGERVTRVAGLVAVAGGLVGVALLLSVIGRPDTAASKAWTSFKAGYDDAGAGPSTHLLSLGSSRYDTWRVALDGFRDHPLGGVGARGFGPVYLVEGRSEETPARAHSLPADVLLEQGAIGFLLLALAVGAPLVLVARAARRRRANGVAALGGCVGWLAHASVDWTWTFPAAGIPFFLLLGVGAAGLGRDDSALPRRATIASVVAGIAAVALLVPPFLSARLTQHAAQSPAGASGALRWAERLDPVSVEPLLVRAQVVPGEGLRALAEAARKEPRSVRVRYAHGTALLAARRFGDAERELRAAERLSPGEPLIEAALAQARDGLRATTSTAAARFRSPSARTRSS